MSTIVLDVATEFTATPGGRYAADGPYSGEQMYEECLKRKLDELLREICDDYEDDTYQLVVDFSGCMGVPASFLDEVFFRAGRDYSVDFYNRYVTLKGLTKQQRVWVLVAWSTGYNYVPEHRP